MGLLTYLLFARGGFCLPAEQPGPFEIGPTPETSSRAPRSNIPNASSGGANSASLPQHVGPSALSTPEVHGGEYDATKMPFATKEAVALVLGFEGGPGFRPGSL